MPTFEDVTDMDANGGHAEGGISPKLVMDMVPFLRDPRPEIRQAAAATAVAASASKEGIKLLHECGAVKWLCRISGDVGTIAADAVSVLVNVSAEDTSVAALEDMCTAGIVNRMMEAVSAVDCAPHLRDLCLQLLANVTRVQTGAEKVAQVGVAGGTREGQHLRNLALWLVKYQAEEGLDYPEVVGSGRDEARVVDRRSTVDTSEEGGGGGGMKRRVVLDQWQHCASVLCNAARIPEGRRALRRPEPSALGQLLPQLSSANPIRRWGLAGCVRNCCFEEAYHPWLLHEVRVVPHLLMRLSDDADEYDFDEKVVLDPRIWKKENDAPPRRREPLEVVKRDVVEALLQLCSTLDSRQSLRKMGVYLVIRELDKSEPEGEISQVCYNLVNFLQRDEHDKQGRIDYLKSLQAAEEKEQDHKQQLREQNGDRSGEQMSATERTGLTREIIPAPIGSPGTSEDRAAYLRAKNSGDNPAGCSCKTDGGVIAKVGGDGAGEEEIVEKAGADAVSAMLSTFDDSDEES